VSGGVVVGRRRPAGRRRARTVSGAVRCGAAALLVAVLLLAPAVAQAEEVSGAELRALAARAIDDPAALERLRGVNGVDGRPADVAGALEGASGEELRARLEALAIAGAAERAGGAAGAREEAREIVSGRRFSPPEVPGPFRGALERLADWLAPVLDLIPALDDVIPGGRPVVWALLVLLVGGVAALLAGRALRRRATGDERRALGGATVAEDPDELERRAREAAARGEHELALRLGFRAGLARLDRRGVIELRPSLSTGDVARVLRSPQFDRTAARFDEVVYGRRPAAADDVDEARAAWSAVLDERRAA
jgi:Domain of unknown function (DUF4129)